MAELNAIHPFREGNGRTQREFLNQLAYRNNMMIEWTKIPAKDILKATIESYSGNTRLLIQLIENNLTLQ
jgi:cell filamentation protein